MTQQPDLFLIDASVYVFRAYYSIPDEFFDQDGNPANAVYGFAGFLCTLLQNQRPSHIGIAFDEALESSFRNDIFPDYKANREPAPIELKRQFLHCRALAEALGIACFSDARFEADDLIGTLAERKRPQHGNIHVISADKDLTQLIRNDDTWWDLARNNRLNREQVNEKFGVYPEQIADYLALTGDKVDNIPGVPGIGPKSAAALLQHFGTLSDLLERIDEVAFLRLRGAKSLSKKLHEHQEAARLARRLTEISVDAPIPDPEPSLKWQGPDLDAINELFDFLKFGRLLRQRCEQLKP